MLPFLDEPEVRKHLEWDALIAAMENALIDFSAGRVQQPVRRLLKVEPHGGYFAAMPAASAETMGAKLVTFYPGNAARGLPTHLAVIVLFKPETGEALALLDGRLITEMRTAAVSAAATKVLAARERRKLGELMAELVRTGLEYHRTQPPVDEARRLAAEQWLADWLKLGEEMLRNAPPGPTASEILAADRNRLERR